MQVQPCSTPSSFRPDLKKKKKKPDKAPSGSTARHPIPTYDAVQVQCIQKVSICSNPPKIAIQSFVRLFIRKDVPAHAHTPAFPDVPSSVGRKPYSGEALLPLT